MGKKLSVRAVKKPYVTPSNRLNPFRVTIKVQNNYLWERMQQCGFESALALARACGVSPADVGEYLNLKRGPYQIRSHKYYSSIEKIALVLETPVESLFPPRILFGKIPKKNVFVASLSDEQLRSLGGRTASQIEAREGIDLMLATLDARRRDIVESYCGLNGPSQNFMEIAERHGISHVRAAQLYAEGLRKIRDNKKLDRSGLCDHDDNLAETYLLKE